ncbi:hypothetical protein DOY81_006250 [Sarcophaga bullata]|nr:hypothetical protein DOY81_006250 [Sarcophaga bullata]
MNVPRNYIVVGLVLFIMCTNQNCKAGMIVECPNLPITPYPPVQQVNSPGIVQPSTVPCQTTSPPNMCQTNCVQNPPVIVTPKNPCQTACGQVPTATPCQNHPCPTIPTNPCQTACGQTPPVNPCQNYPCPTIPTNPCQTSCGQAPTATPCQNYPCPTIQTNSCQTACGQAPPANPCQNYPCPTIPTNPCQTACGQTPPVNPCQNYPCPTIPTNPCQTACGQNQPAGPCPDRSCPITPIAPQPLPPPPPPPPMPTPPPPPPPPIIITTTPPPTITFPPPSLMKCPPGTILIGDICHIIYCPFGTVMKNDRCMLIECPDGTVWTGHRCSVPEPLVQSFSFNHTITMHVNQTTPDIIVNNTKNIVVNAPVTINEHATNNVNCNNDYEDCDEEEDTTIAPTTETTIQNCCEVMTPRICEERNNRWHCYSRRSRRCGDFCIAPIIYLKPPRIYARPKHVIMPPIQRECESYGTCGSMIGGHDCSGCSVNNMSRCSYYCYRYSCPSQKCNFFDQKQYCANKRFGMFGCQMTDGCYDDWCLNN